MSYFKRKAPPFTLGLLLGIVIAGTFFMFRLDNYIKELSFYKNVSETFSSEEPPIEKPTESVKKSDLTKIKNKKQSESAVIKNTDKKKTETSTDSIHSTDSIVKTASYADDIVIRKDELLNVRTIELKNLNTPMVKNHTDSLLEKISDIKDDKRNVNKYVQVEFWRSPLNYKGYKLSKYSVILYGLPDTEGLKLYTLDDVFYIRNASTVYKLEYNSDFKPYERVVDEGILSNLK